MELDIGTAFYLLGRRFFVALDEWTTYFFLIYLWKEQLWFPLGVAIVLGIKFNYDAYKNLDRLKEQYGIAH